MDFKPVPDRFRNKRGVTLPQCETHVSPDLLLRGNGLLKSENPIHES